MAFCLPKSRSEPIPGSNRPQGVWSKAATVVGRRKAAKPWALGLPRCRGRDCAQAMPLDAYRPYSSLSPRLYMTLEAAGRASPSPPRHHAAVLYVRKPQAALGWTEWMYCSRSIEAKDYVACSQHFCHWHHARTSDTVQYDINASIPKAVLRDRCFATCIFVAKIIPSSLEALFCSGFVGVTSHHVQFLAAMPERTYTDVDVQSLRIGRSRRVNCHS